jgi:hypothetical protein
LAVVTIGGNAGRFSLEIIESGFNLPNFLFGQTTTFVFVTIQLFFKNLSFKFRDLPLEAFDLALVSLFHFLFKGREFFVNQLLALQGLSG